MTCSKTIIPFSSLRFIDDLPRSRDVEGRLMKFLNELRKRSQRDVVDEEAIHLEAMPFHFEEIDKRDIAKIRRRSTRYLDRVRSSTGTNHLSDEIAVNP